MELYMQIRQNLMLQYLGWFLAISIIPVGSILKNTNELIPYLITEILLIAFIVWNYFRNKDKEIIYASDNDKIIITGSKEGIYDQGIIKICDIDYVNDEGKTLLIKMNNGNEIRLVRLGKNKTNVLNDIEEKMKNKGTKA
jgi:hypothetical protein